MRWRVATALAASLAVGCALVTPLDDLRGDGGSDGAPADAAPDAPGASDASDASDAALDGGAEADASQSGLLARWTFDEDGGTTAHDVSGHGHDGLVLGGSWVAGKSGGALLLNGTSDYVAVPPSTDFDRPAGASFSITAWLSRVGTFSHEIVVAIEYGSSSAAYGLEAQSNTLMNYWDGVSHVATSAVSFVQNEWHHIAVVVTGGAQAKVYFDGVPVGTAIPDDTPRTCTRLTLGASNYGDFFPGAIDDVRFYGRALSDSEVAATMSP